MTIDGVTALAIRLIIRPGRPTRTTWTRPRSRNRRTCPREALAREIGDTWEGFIKASGDRLIVHLGGVAVSGGLHYCVAVRVSDGMARRVRARDRLGLDTPENEADELSWAMRRRELEEPPS